ncbi:MAG: PEGA domain-containing protein [Myxococcales bacterium]|nr:PEGA domain-containing protein [Myxococcales bacterium]
MGVTTIGPLGGACVGCVLGVLAAGCGPARAPGSHGKATVSLRLRGTPTDASVIVDDEALGPLDFVAAHGVALPPGVHHITVEARGYFPWDHEVEAPDKPDKGGRAPPIVLDVSLVPVPD